MTDRTYQQRAQGYGSTPCSIRAKIDGTIVFEGEISTLNEVLPKPAPWPLGAVIFDWIKPIEWSGNVALEIEVIHGLLLLTTTECDYNIQMPRPDIDVTQITLTPEEIAENKQKYGANKFFPLANYQTLNGVVVNDPCVDVVIDGTPVERGAELLGQVYWKLDTGQTFACTVVAQFGQGATSP
jgi:hypothetical protein